MANHGPSYGLSRELERKNQARFSLEEALEVLLWIEQVTDIQMADPPLGQVHSSSQVSELLKDGITLCILMNRLMGSTACTAVKFHKNPRMPFHKMENISNFLDACKAFGVAEISLFQTVDLYENKQCYKVIECLRSLAAVAQSKFKLGAMSTVSQFPPWVVKMAQNQPRKFTPEIIRQGEAVIPLQYGTNKCASQKGMTPLLLNKNALPNQTIQPNAGVACCGFGFGGDCCCGDCCCDCCCGCCAPALLAIPCGCGDSFGLYGGSIFGRRRRKRQEIEVKREELYADKGPRSADFLNNHKCADQIWLTLLARKWAKQSADEAASKQQANVAKTSAKPMPNSSKIVRDGPHTRRMKRLFSRR
uniref:Calponin-homology (CH) domain-containing protein n=1 Tax=Globodera rostochiensis TaxID=31243 RepID=A0A914GVS3_GLORO